MKVFNKNYSLLRDKQIVGYSAASLKDEVVELNQPQKGDILCVYGTGAYCYSMSSNYNRMLKPAMILINDGKSEIIVKRQTLEDLVSNDIVLERLK